MSPLNQMYFHREIFADGSNKPNSTLDKFGDEANKFSVPRGIYGDESTEPNSVES